MKITTDNAAYLIDLKKYEAKAYTMAFCTKGLVADEQLTWIGRAALLAAVCDELVRGSKLSSKSLTRLNAIKAKMDQV